MFDQYLPAAQSLNVFDVHVTSTVPSCTPLLTHEPWCGPTSTNGAFLYFCYTLLYYGLSLYLRSSALCHLGSNTSRRDACLGCDANYVHLPAATGQYGYSGHVFNLPHDVASFSNTLPRLPSELDVIIVRK